MHREAAASAGLHLFQELSTLGPAGLRQGPGRVEPLFRARPVRPRQPFEDARSGTSTAV
jgi:hypothetical protein